jgi:hypothetical protein
MKLKKANQGDGNAGNLDALAHRGIEIPMAPMDFRLACSKLV